MALLFRPKKSINSQKEDFLLFNGFLSQKDFTNLLQIKTKPLF
jgi:hypothetical protein